MEGCISSQLKKYGTGFEAGEHSGAALRGRRRMPIGARFPPSDQGVGRYVEFFNRLSGKPPDPAEEGWKHLPRSVPILASHHRSNNRLKSLSAGIR